MALKQLVFKKILRGSKLNFIFFLWRNCSRQIARHLAIQYVNNNYLNINPIFLNE